VSANVRRALTTAFVVGPVLTVINQTPLLARLLHGEGVPAAGAVRIALTFVVPFAVSLYSSTMADRKRR
jgi:hypothetical protein